jgi:hypothetical protein
MYSISESVRRSKDIGDLTVCGNGKIGTKVNNL